MLEITAPLDKLKEQLEREPGLGSKKFNITQSEEVNENPNRVPWLGIYRKKVTHDPLTLGTTARRWKGKIELILVVQAASLKSGADCSALLEAYTKDVVTAVINDTSFGNSIDMVNQLTVDYSYKRTDAPSLHFQEAFVTLVVEVEHEE